MHPQTFVWRGWWYVRVVQSTSGRALALRSGNYRSFFYDFVPSFTVSHLWAIAYQTHLLRCSFSVVRSRRYLLEVETIIPTSDLSLILSWDADNTTDTEIGIIYFLGKDGEFEILGVTNGVRKNDLLL